MFENNIWNSDFKSDLSGLTTKYFNYIFQLNALLPFPQKLYRNLTIKLNKPVEENLTGQRKPYTSRRNIPVVTTI